MELATILQSNRIWTLEVQIPRLAAVSNPSFAVRLAQQIHQGAVDDVDDAAWNPWNRVAGHLYAFEVHIGNQRPLGLRRKQQNAGRLPIQKPSTM